MTDKRLKSIADRIEKLMDDRDDIQSDIRDVYAEAKSAGYVPKVLRKAITRKRMDPDKRDEEDTILDLYEDALSPKMRRAVEMARGGATSREIEDETGIDHATVARSVALNKKSATVMTKADGVITETGESCGSCPVSPAEGAGKGNGLPSAKGNAEDSPAARRHTSDDALAPALGISQCADDAAPGPHDHNADEATATPSVGAVGPSSGRVAHNDHDDDLSIPAHLRGPSPSNRGIRA